ncbi:hypothetical protein E2C01_005043 [Portunus trituberculatus]|uniref:Uncharacterized protein n=1 Tax=Portunus trituberculatus TaxID=210409 RepID=A0A5B7CVK5_PORTR|nr:hypothetical protein [Portunus trituberculatus]
MEKNMPSPIQRVSQHVPHALVSLPLLGNEVFQLSQLCLLQCPQFSFIHPTTPHHRAPNAVSLQRQERIAQPNTAILEQVLDTFSLCKPTINQSQVQSIESRICGWCCGTDNRENTIHSNQSTTTSMHYSLYICKDNCSLLRVSKLRKQRLENHEKG